MSKSTYHHGDLRNTLIKTAISMMSANGITKVSLRAIAKAAGVSSAAPFKHFQDKAALLEAIAAVGFQTIYEGNTEAMSSFAKDPVEQLKAAGYAYLIFAVNNPEIISLMFGGGVSLQEGSDELTQAWDQAFKSLKCIIENGQEAGLFKQVDSYDLALTTFSMVHGLSVMLTAGPLKIERTDENRINELGNILADILLKGILIK